MAGMPLTELARPRPLHTRHKYIQYEHNINTLTCRRYHLDESSASWLWDKDTLLELDVLLQQPSDVAYHSLKYDLSVMDSLDKTYIKIAF